MKHQRVRKTLTVMMGKGEYPNASVHADIFKRANLAKATLLYIEWEMPQGLRFSMFTKIKGKWLIHNMGKVETK